MSGKKIAYLCLSLAFVLSVFTGCAEEPLESEETQIETDARNYKKKKDVSGWWIRPEEENSPGLSLFDCFYIDEDLSKMVIYNQYGEESGEFECSFDGDVLNFDMDMYESSLIYEKNRLLDPDSGKTVFVSVDEPDFEGQDLDYSGCWYHCGDMNRDYYEISGSDFKKFRQVSGESYVEYEGTFQKVSTQQYLSNLMFPDVLKLESEDFGPVLIPDQNSDILFEELDLDYGIYIHEDALDEDLVEGYSLIDDMMNMDLWAYENEEKSMLIRFTPYCFYVSSCTADENGNLNLEDPFVQGSWYLEDSDTLVLEFEDGEMEYVTMPEEDGEFYVEWLDAFFEMDPFFF